MIEHVHIRNFKCLQDTEMDLLPLTVLIGPNDSGKSSLVEAIQLLGKTTQSPWNGVFHGDQSLENLVWNKDKTLPIRWDIKGSFGDSRFEYSLALLPTSPFPQHERLVVDGGEVFSWDLAPHLKEFRVKIGDNAVSLQGHHTVLHGMAKDKNLRMLCGLISASGRYLLDAKLMRQPSAPHPNATLTMTGENLVAVLEAIWTGPNPQGRQELEKALHDEMPAIRGISLPTHPSNEKALEFVLSQSNNGVVTIPAQSASDGVVLLTGFLVLAYSETPDLTFIEEPENGLHYSRLKRVLDLLRKMSEGKIGNKQRQIVLTTHSPILLNLVRPEEVRIFHRPNQGGTVVRSMSQVHDIERLKEEFATGELWFLLGEEGLLKESPK